MFFSIMDLLDAVEGNDLCSVKKLLDRGAGQAHIGRAYIDQALCNASDNGYVEIVKLLLSIGANVHYNNDESLRYASWCGHTEVVRVLLNAGADVHIEFDKPIRVASWNGHFEIVKLLIDRGADIYSKVNRVLYNACVRGNNIVADELLRRGASLSNLKLLDITDGVCAASVDKYICKRYWCRWRRYVLSRWARRLLRAWFRPDMYGGKLAKKQIFLLHRSLN